MERFVKKMQLNPDNRLRGPNMSEQVDEIEITVLGNPGHPEGEAGKQMLDRMNLSHDAVTNWGLDHLILTEKAPQLLDIGCGGGATLSRLLNRYPHSTVYGVDYSEVSVEQSRMFNSAFVESGQVRVIQASVENLPFRDEFFHAITTVESFYFWPNPQENLKEVNRVLKAGGMFLLIADIYENGHLPEKARENVRRFHLYNPPMDEFRELFQHAGFDNIHVHTKEGTSWICVSGTKPE